MIDHVNHVLYVDFSTLAQFRTCKEKCRLASTEGWQLTTTPAPLSFGHAFHAGRRAYYDARASGYRDAAGRWQRFIEPQDATVAAKVAFLRDLKIEGNELPISLESGERRSLERGLALLEAYIVRWSNEPYESILDESGAPMNEIGFRYYLCEYNEWPIYYVGYIDDLMRNRTTTRPVIVETKTTTQALSMFIQGCKPNYQVTGYFPAAWKLLAREDIFECVWDCIYVSSRASNVAKSLKERFWLYGIDIENDFRRQTTTRSKTDVEEWRADIIADAKDYCDWLTSPAKRWPRNAPGACHNYGGCQFRNVCSTNGAGAQSVLETFFEKKPWRPFEKILAMEKLVDG